MLRKEKDIEIQYAPDLAFAEIFKIIAPFHCILQPLGNTGYQGID